MWPSYYTVNSQNLVLPNIVKSQATNQTPWELKRNNRRGIKLILRPGRGSNLALEFLYDFRESTLPNGKFSRRRFRPQKWRNKTEAESNPYIRSRERVGRWSCIIITDWTREEN